MEDYTTLTDEKLDSVFMAVIKEKQRRSDIAKAMTVSEEVAIACQTSVVGREDGDQWNQPLGSFDSYPKGWSVKKDDKVWISLVDNNVWEPGIANWREESVDISAWIQPTGATDVYALGDIVSHNDKEWKSIIDNNVWEPGVYGWEENAKN